MWLNSKKKIMITTPSISGKNKLKTDGLNEVSFFCCQDTITIWM